MRVEQYSVKPRDTVGCVAQQLQHHARAGARAQRAGSERPARRRRLAARAIDIRGPARQGGARRPLVDNRLANVPVRAAGRTAVHVVRRGDTLSSPSRGGWATWTSVTLAQPQRHEVGDTLRAGQRLVVAASAAPARPRAAARHAPARRATAIDGKKVTYIVRRGDTLYSVARTLQVTVGQLLELERPGQQRRHQARSATGGLRRRGLVLDCADERNTGWQARTDRRGRHRAFDRLGHRAGHEGPGRGTGTLLRQR